VIWEYIARTRYVLFSALVVGAYPGMHGRVDGYARALAWRICWHCKQGRQRRKEKYNSSSICEHDVLSWPHNGLACMHGWWLRTNASSMDLPRNDELQHRSHTLFQWNCNINLSRSRSIAIASIPQLFLACFHSPLSEQAKCQERLASFMGAIVAS
jgi:hypothetical protein